MNRTVSALLVAIFSGYWVQIAVLILAPLKAVELGYPAWAAAALAALWGLIAVVLDLPASALSDLRGRRASVMAGGALMAAGAAQLALAADYLGLAIGIAIYSVGQAFTVGPMLAFLTEASPRDQLARVQGINGAVQAVSSVVAALAAGLLAQLGFFVAFIPAIVASVVLMVATFSTRETTKRSLPGQWRRTVLGAHVQALRMATRPAVGFAALGVILFGILFTVIASTILPLVLVDLEGYPVALVGLLVAFRNLVGAGVSLSFAPVTRRIGVPRAVLQSGWLGVIGTALLAVTTQDPILLIVPLALQGIGVAYTAPAGNVLVTDATATSERAVGIAAMTVSSRVTVLIIPLVLAPFLAAGAGGAVFVIAAAIGSVVLLGMHLVARQITPADPDVVFAPAFQTVNGPFGADDP